MNYGNNSNDLLESFNVYRKIVFLMFLNQNNKKFLREIGFSERDISRLSLEFRSILIEQHDEN